MVNAYFEKKLQEIREDDMQLAAYKAVNNTVVIAGPGSGKTTVLTLKVMQLLAEVIYPPRGLACLTYSTEAVREFKSRLVKLGLEKRKNVFLGTVHSFCLSEIITPFAALYPQYKIPLPIRIISEAEKISAFTASERYPDEIDNFNKLLETARSHDTQLTIKFLTRLGIPENQVVLTTRHSSKGLEFDVVILPGMEKDSFPSYYDNTPRKLAEARRLCFVSVSRARKACILIRSKNLQNKYGRWFSKEPSPFWVALQEFQDSRSN